MLSDILSVKKVRCEGINRYFITLDLNHIAISAELVALYSALCSYCADRKIIPVYEKIFGSQTFSDIFADVKSQHLFSGVPSTFVNYKVVQGGIISSVFLYGIDIIDSENCSIDFTKYSAEIITPHIRCIYIQNVQGGESSMAVYRNLFHNLESVFENRDFYPRDIVRTWFYMDHIISNYGEFNHARTDFFNKYKIGYSKEDARLPASTCIGAPVSHCGEIIMDAYCVLPLMSGVTITRIYSEHQNEAEGEHYLFKPTFSRAIKIETPNYTEIQLSGTASINKTGETIFLNDPLQQIIFTLENVGSILRQFDMSFENFVQTTCFFKDENYYISYIEALNKLGIDNFSYTFVIGDVCRYNLLFELDGVAIKEKL